MRCERWLVGGVILTHELFRSAAKLAPEGEEVGLALPHLMGGEKHGMATAGAKWVLGSVQRVQ
jgi:hypothetical protein